MEDILPGKDQEVMRIIRDPIISGRISLEELNRYS